MSSPESYVGIDGLAVNPQTPLELWKSIDALHTMVMDNMPASEQEPLLAILSETMDKIEAAFPDTEFFF